MKPKFTLNRPKVSDDEINQHKDFDKLVKQFKEQSIQKARSDVNFLKNKKATYAAVIAGVTVLCTVTYFTVFKKPVNTTSDHEKIATLHHSQKNTAPSSSTAFIKPPSKTITVPYTSYKVNAAAGGEIKHHTQSKIKVPAKTFVNKQGADITGEVEIRYREFHNQADIIASGIPMTYDSAGTQYHFESAGMLDIRGYQNGEPVFIKPGKQITVEFASRQTADHFNQYELDTIGRKWTFIRRDHIASSPAIANREDAPGHDMTKSPKIATLQQQILAIPPKVDSVKVVYTKKIDQLHKSTTAPAKPQKANAGRPQFELDVDYKEFPELAAFKNAVFEVGAENKNYSNDMTNITWSSAEISEGPEKGKNYLLTLRLKSRVEKLIVYPALTGADYETAMKQYDKKLADYNTLLNKRLADEKRLQEEMAQKQKAYMEAQKKLEADLLREQIRIQRENEAKMAEQFKNADNQGKVTRVFQVSRFGIQNSDCPSSMPKGGKVNPMFVSAETGSSITPEQVYMVEHARNIVYNLYCPACNSISYNPAQDYSLCILSHGSLYLYHKDQFKSSIQKGNNTFTLTKVPDDINDVNDLKTALGI